MKKIIAILILCVTLLLSLGVIAAAYQNHEDCVNVIFTENSVFTDEEKQVIENYFKESIDDTNSYGIRCTLFGHNYITELVDVIRHKVRATKPRCDKETYETKICSVCSHTVSELIFLTSTNCCE